MSDVFISYKREDESRVALLQASLIDAGLDVWWDKDITGGARWRQSIETQLESTKCVLVVWSKASTGPHSDIVIDEANRGRRRRVLLQVRIDEVGLPLGFGEHQCLDLVNWTGSRADTRLQNLIDTLRAFIGGAAAPRPRSVVQGRLRFGLSARLLAAMIIFITVLTFGAVYKFGVRPSKPSGSHIKSLAVLPFRNVGNNPEWEYLSDGITESMINRLSRIRNLRVMSRSAVFRVRQSNADPIGQGRRLKVDAVLTGSIRQFPDHLEASVELVDCDTGGHLWGEHYKQSYSDPLIFEKSAVEDTATQLHLQMNGAEKAAVARSYSLNLDIYRLYLKGRYEWNKRSVEGSKRAIQYFQQVLDADPSYAPAYSGIADSYSFESGYLPAAEVFPKAQAAAQRALELDPDLAEAHTSLGFVYLMYAWDWRKAEAEFHRALDINPNYASAHSFYARLLTVLGRFPEAEREIGKAQILDPLSPGIATGVGVEYYLARDYGRAEKQFQSLLQMDPKSPGNISYLALTHAVLKKTKQAVAAAERHVAENPSDLAALADLTRIYSLDGQTAKGLETLKKIKKSSALDALLPTSLAEAYGALGKLDQAFAELDRGYSQRCWYLIFLNVEPIFDPLRQDARFKAMQEKMGLAI